MRRPSRTDDWDRYLGLADGLRQVLRLKSLVVPAVGKSAFADCLLRSGLRDAQGRAWTSRSLNAALEQLTAQGLLTPDLGCPEKLAHAIAVDACAAAEGPAMVAAVRRAFPPDLVVASWRMQTSPNALPRLLRLAVHANDAAAYGALREQFERLNAPSQAVQVLELLFAGASIGVDWVASRAPLLQVALFEAKCVALLSEGASDPDLPALVAHFRAQRGRDGFGPAQNLLRLLDLLAGRLPDTPDLAPGDATGMALAGMQAFLAGRGGEALAAYRAALKLHRKQVGKRSAFLPGMHGMWFLLALLAANDAGLQPEVQSGLTSTLAGPAAQAKGFLAIQALLWQVQGLQAKAREQVEALRAAMPADPLGAACVALAEYAVDPALSRRHRADLATRFEQLRDSLPLIARIHAEILAEVAAAPRPYRAFLDAAPAGIAFIRLIQIRPAWERALESLDAFLDGGTAADARPVRRTRRLAWFLDPASRHVEVAEQAARGQDGWTDGRAVAMKRLHEQDPRLDYLTAQDRVALRCIRREVNGYYDEVAYAFDTPRLLLALIGHPAVFNAAQRAQALELVAYPLELVVSEVRDGFHIALSHTATEPTVFLEAETPTRYRVIEFPARLLAVQEILGHRGLTVPARARDQLIAMIRRNSPNLPIRAEIAEADQAAIEGNPAPVVQLLPDGDGLKVSLLVRPFGAEGPAFVAGIGARSVLATIAGERLRATRDLAREAAERTALLDACPILRDRAGTGHELVVEDLEGCLELLLELQSYTGGVSLEWPEGKKLRVAAIHPDRMKLRVAQDRDWFGVDGTVALDGDQVLEMRFLLERLDRARGRFVPLEDGSFVALTRQLQTQLQTLAAVSEPHRGGRRVHRLGAPALDAVLEEAGEVKTDAAWKRQVKAIRAAGGLAPSVPATLQAELRDYQVEGFVWLSRLASWGAGACLADDMGLGKTVQAIAVMLDRAEQGPCLVVAPTSVCPNWEAELRRFAPTLTVHRLAGAADRAALIAGVGPREVLVCSYGLLHQEAESLGARAWQMAVLDEAQAIKNAQTKRAQATASLQAGLRLALTGTPVENYLEELWSLFNFVNPGLLGSRESFQKRFAGPIERDRDPHARQALRALIRPFLLRRTKAAVLSELPPRTEQTVLVEMSETERAFYEVLRQRALTRLAALEGAPGQRKLHILAEISKLRRACCNPALIDAEAGVPSGKLEAFLTLVDELVRNRHRALVFSQFTGHLGLVRAALEARGVAYEYLDGSTPAAERERRVAAFQGGRGDLFLISLRAGGTGLNLTAADYVVHLDPWWNPAVEDQASDRAHRIGQMRPVTVYRLIMQDSIEERILALHRDKRDLAADLLDGAETTGRMSEEELLGLIRG